MPERSSIAQVVQIGVESTPGTAVAATKRLAGLTIAPSVRGTFRTFRSSGFKYPSVAYPGKEWSESDLSGDALYSELHYPLGSVITSGTVAQLMDTATPTGAYLWTFDPASSTEDTPKTFTVEQGSAVRAHRSAYTLVNEFNLDFNRDSVEIGGTAIGKAIEDGVTLTGSPTSIDPVPIIPTQLSVYADTAAAGLGTTKLGRILSGSFSISNRFSPLWVVDAANPSFVAHVETEPEVTCTLMMEADADGMAHLLKMRTAASVFIRIEGVGAQIYDTTGTVNDRFHRLWIDVCGKITNEPPFSDEDGVYAVEFTFSAIHDNTWGRAFKIELTNKATAY